MTRPHVVVVGDVVLDRDVDGRSDRLCPDAPVPVVDVTSRRESPGGAGLTALLVAASGARVTVVAPLADDRAGRTLAEQLAAHATVVPLGHDGPTRRKVRVRSAGQSLLRLDDGGPGTPRDVPVERLREVLASADVVLVSDYGAGVTRDPAVRSLLADAARERPVVWDPHPRGGPPVAGAALVTPNLAEARRACADLPGAAGRPAEPGPAVARPAVPAPAAGPAAPDELAAALRALWSVDAVSVTAGAAGAFVALTGSDPVYAPAPAVAGGDPCGAGDRFAATAAVAIARGAGAGEAVVRAVGEASAWVASGGAEAYRVRTTPTPPPRPTLGPRAVVAGGGSGDGHPEPGAPAESSGDGPALAVAHETVEDVAVRLHARGRLVATGGCFDIVHAGHVATLQAARRLGDALVVVINSDASVRRLKGPGRPVVTAADRARVLEAFDCVDAVVVFDEDDPTAVLDRLRPHVWAKGGDYSGAELPEAGVVRRHGGRVVLLPYLGGRSTTSIIERSQTTPTTDRRRTTA